MHSAIAETLLALLTDCPATLPYIVEKGLVRLLSCLFVVQCHPDGGNHNKCRYV